MGRSLLRCSFSHSFSHTHSHWLSQGSGLQKGYWGCGSAGCVMQCFGSHVFPGNSQGFFSLSARAHRGREQLTRNIHTYLSSSLFWNVTVHGQGDFFVWLGFVKSNLCHRQISIIRGSNLFLATLFHNPSNHEKLFPLMSHYGHIIPVALLYIPMLIRRLVLAV